MRVVCLILWAGGCLGQTDAFSVASVKTSASIVGKDRGDRIAFLPNGFSGRNVTLKTLIVEAYHVQPHQVSGGPKWLDSAEYDVEAKTAEPGAREQKRLALRALLAERFGLMLHRETKEMRVYELVIDKNGPKIKPSQVEEPDASFPVFHGDMQHFASLLTVQLSIHVMEDPSKPGMAGSTQTPVVNKTGLDGIYDIRIDRRPEPGTDVYTLWQRVLRDELGLKLQSGKSAVELLLVDHAERMPTAN
jgi:uncharacterized protein (TIGR03435 family)